MTSPADGVSNNASNVLMAGMFCACAATLISAILTVFFWAAPAHALGHWYQAPKAILVICLFTSVPAGLFGFLCGVLGDQYLRYRSKHFSSRSRLLAEAAALGLLLSAGFPLFHKLMRWEPAGDFQDWRSLAFGAAVGVPVAVLYAAVFRRSLAPQLWASAPRD